MVFADRVFKYARRSKRNASVKGSPTIAGYEGKVWAPFFPKYVLLEPGDAARGFAAVALICVLASALAIHAALKVDPAEAIGG